jgi:hypothetical protein
MSRISGTALAGLAAALVPLCAQTPGAALPPLVIDGSLGDAFWAAVRRQNLQPDEAGIPAELGGTFALALRGNWLCFAAQMPEPGGKVLARAFGPHVIWQKDADGAPPVEDRLEYRLHYRAAGGAEHVLAIGINPWGGYRLEQDGAEAPDSKIEVAAVVSSSAWTVEAALLLSSLDLPRSGSLCAGAPNASVRAGR